MKLSGNALTSTIAGAGVLLLGYLVFGTQTIEMLQGIGSSSDTELSETGNNQNASGGLLEGVDLPNNSGGSRVENETNTELDTGINNPFGDPSTDNLLGGDSYTSEDLYSLAQKGLPFELPGSEIEIADGAIVDGLARLNWAVTKPVHSNSEPYCAFIEEHANKAGWSTVRKNCTENLGHIIVENNGEYVDISFTPESPGMLINLYKELG